MNASQQEEAPIPNEEEPVFKQVIADLQERAEFGFKKYGVYLQPFNGRNAAMDAYQETLDHANYMRQLLDEWQIYADIIKALDKLFMAEEVKSAEAALTELRYLYIAYLSKTEKK
jgi:hypothetical protein